LADVDRTNLPTQSNLSVTRQVIDAISQLFVDRQEFTKQRALVEDGFDVASNPGARIELGREVVQSAGYGVVANVKSRHPLTASTMRERSASNSFA
jgi:hypothetical protein